MVSGHLTAKKNHWYAVLNLKYPDGRRYSKWISTGLTIAGNKRKADERLQELRRQYSLGGDIHSSGILFTGYMSGWLKTIWPVVAATTYHSYQKLTHEICAYFEPLAAALRSLDDGQPVLDAERVAQRPHRPRAAPKVVELAPAVERRGVPQDVVVDVATVSVGADDVGVLALEEALGKLHADAVRLLRRDLAWLEGLAHLVGNDVARLLPARELPVLALGQQKLRVRRVWVTGERGDKFSVFSFIWIHCIARAELQRRSHALSAVHGYDPRYRYAATPSAVHGVLDGVPQPVQLGYEPRSEHKWLL